MAGWEDELQRGLMPFLAADVPSVCCRIDRSYGHVTSLIASQLDKRGISFEAHSRASRASNATVQAGRCFGRD